MPVTTIRRLRNPVQHYAWGSHTAIPDLLGLPSPAADPCAELWLGAHPRASSQVLLQTGWRALNELIAAVPREILGPGVADAFADNLPFLLKVLAAEKPLSIQAHPDKKQAEEGFVKENRAGIALDAPNRNYKDANHKPECLCALTPFDALCGFRQIPEILSGLSLIRLEQLDRISRQLTDRPDAIGLALFFETLLTLSRKEAANLVAGVVAQAPAPMEADDAFAWVVRLNREYPGDIGVLAPLFLNLITLSPGQAIFLPARVLHAYLGGVGIEIMANSDNVLRGGLTSKHVDPAELLRSLDFQAGPPEILAPVPVGQYECVYPTPAAEFVLSVIDMPCAGSYQSVSDRASVEILLCVSGGATIREAAAGSAGIDLKKGEAVLVPGATGQYRLSGEALIYKAAVPKQPAQSSA